MVAGGAALAAAAILAVALPLGIRRPEQVAVVRSSDVPRIESILAPELMLPRSRARLAWSGGPAATVYTVTLTTARGEVLGQHRVEAPEFVVPAALLARVPPGETLKWTVEGQLPDGRRLDPRTFTQRLTDE
jgi:hypothetical protein